MRIDDANKLAQSQTTDKVQQSGLQAPGVRQPGEARGDRAEISGLALAQASHTIEPTDPKRLDALKLAVASGTYRVSASELSASIIDAHTKA